MYPQVYLGTWGVPNPLSPVCCMTAATAEQGTGFENAALKSKLKFSPMSVVTPCARSLPYPIVRLIACQMAAVRTRGAEIIHLGTDVVFSAGTGVLSVCKKPFQSTTAALQLWGHGAANPGCSI